MAEKAGVLDAIPPGLIVVTYTGPWQFMPQDTGHLISKVAWQAASYNQDADS